MLNADPNVVANVGANISPHGTQMNCDAWGTFESPGTAETAALCNGGTVDGELWAPCPSKEPCRAAKQQRVLANARDNVRQSLPIMGQSSVRFVGNQGQRPMSGVSSGSPNTTLPQRPMGGQPAVIIKPENNNKFLDTPRILAPTRPGMQSPTFLPKKKEGWSVRLGKNILQGFVNAFGWHLHDYTQNVDLFPHDDED